MVWYGISKHHASNITEVDGRQTRKGCVCRMNIACNVYIQIKSNDISTPCLKDNQNTTNPSESKINGKSVKWPAITAPETSDYSPANTPAAPWAHGETRSSAWPPSAARGSTRAVVPSRDSTPRHPLTVACRCGSWIRENGTRLLRCATAVGGSRGGRLRLW